MDLSCDAAFHMNCDRLCVRGIVTEKCDQTLVSYYRSSKQTMTVYVKWRVTWKMHDSLQSFMLDGTRPRT